MTASEFIDPAHPSTWPTDVADYVSGLAKRVLDVDGNGPHRPTVEMRLETLEDEPVELELRSLLGDRRVAMAHATRVLPHADRSTPCSA